MTAALAPAPREIICDGVMQCAARVVLSRNHEVLVRDPCGCLCRRGDAVRPAQNLSSAFHMSMPLPREVFDGLGLHCDRPRNPRERKRGRGETHGIRERVADFEWLEIHVSGSTPFTWLCRAHSQLFCAAPRCQLCPGFLRARCLARAHRLSIRIFGLTLRRSWATAGHCIGMASALRQLLWELLTALLILSLIS